MYSRFFVGLMLVASHLAHCDCAPGREYLFMDIALEETQNGKREYQAKTVLSTHLFATSADLMNLRSLPDQTTCFKGSLSPGHYRGDFDATVFIINGATI